MVLPFGLGGALAVNADCMRHLALVQMALLISNMHRNATPVRGRNPTVRPKRSRLDSLMS